MNNSTLCVLIIEDDNKLRSTLKDYFEQYDFKVFTASDGAEGLSEFSNHSSELHAIILDGMLPKIDGFEVLSEIRKSSDVPVVMVTAREAEEYQLSGYRHGADGYITKPFLMSVLKEQITALIKRYASVCQQSVKKGNLVIDTAAHSVCVDGEPISLTAKEYDLLFYFVRNENILLSREQILNAVWGYDYDGDIRTVDTHIKQLRKKIGDECPYIVSVYGAGYRFEVTGNV